MPTHRLPSRHAKNEGPLSPSNHRLAKLHPLQTSSLGLAAGSLRSQRLQNSSLMLAGESVFVGFSGFCDDL